MKTYKIAYQYTVIGEVEVEAGSLEQAKLMAYSEADGNDHNEYACDGTFQIDEEETLFLNKE